MAAAIFWHDGKWYEDEQPKLLGPMDHAMWMASLAFDGARAFDGLAPDLDRHCARVVDSARKMLLQPTLGEDEVERHGGPAEDGQDHVRLSPMMGLVVEEMRERRRQALRYGAHIGHRHIRKAPGQRLVRQAVHPIHDALVFGFARHAQGRNSPSDRRTAPSGANVLDATRRGKWKRGSGI